MRNASCLFTIVVCLLGVAAPARADLLAVRSGERWDYPQRHVAMPPLPPDMPAIVVTPCPDSIDAVGCYNAATNTIYSEGLDRFSRNHELGHAADVQTLDGAERARFSQIIGYDGEPWDSRVECAYPGDQNCSGTETIGISEAFADEYATCRMGLMPQGRMTGRRGHRRLVGAWVSSYGYTPESNWRQRQICRAITRWVADGPAG